jgi:hypothetical protein
MMNGSYDDALNHMHYDDFAVATIRPRLASVGSGKGVIIGGDEHVAPTPPDATAKTVETTRQLDPAWKKAVLDHNGNRCGWVENGYQCGHTTANGNLEPKSFGSTKPEDCIALCPKHITMPENGA